MEFSHLSSAGGVQLIPKNSAEPWRWKVGWNGIAQLKGAVLDGPTVEEWRYHPAIFTKLCRSCGYLESEADHTY